MDPERLAETLARFRINSPSSVPLSSPPTQTFSGGEFRAVVKDPSNALLQAHYRVFLNPKVMTKGAISSRQVLQIINPTDFSFAMVTAWPQTAVSDQSIRISPAVSRILGAKDGDTLKVVAVKAVPRNPTKKNTIQIRVCNRTLSEGQLLRLKHQLVNALPCICPGAGLIVPDVAGEGLDVRCKIRIEGDEDMNACYHPNDAIAVVNEAEMLNSPDSESPMPLGGLQKEIGAICDLILLATGHPWEHEYFRVQPPRGILIYGPSGVGKSSLVRVVAHKLQMRLLTIHGGELGAGRYYGEAEARLREVFVAASASPNTLIFIDNVEALCPRRDKAGAVGGDSRMTATLLTLLDGITPTRVDKIKAFCIASTDNPDSVDSALRRPGRLDKEVEIGIPTSGQRLDILKRLLEGEATQPKPLDDRFLARVAERTHGFVGADLALVFKEAKLTALKSRSDGVLREDDISAAVARIRPSALREVALDIPKVSWDDIGGQEDVKQKLRESVELPLRNPEVFTRFGIRPPKGILLYGPPGCSKTMMAKAVATESGLNFFAIKGPEIFSKWVGDSEKAIAEIFRKARLAAPSIVFFDEFDAIGKKRDTSSCGSSVSERVLSQLLGEMDGIHPLTNVTVIAATNRPDIIDEALLRPGRFDRHVFVSMPDVPARRKILEIGFRRMILSETVSLDQLARHTEGYTGAEIFSLCQEAAIQAFIENPDTVSITADHLDHALKIVRPRTPKAMLAFFKEYSGWHAT